MVVDRNTNTHYRINLNELVMENVEDFKYREVHMEPFGIDGRMNKLEDSVVWKWI